MFLTAETALEAFSMLLYASMCLSGLQDDHWLLRHETMEALVGLARSTATTDLLQFVPRSTFNPGRLCFFF